MDFALSVAQFFGIYYVAMGLGMLIQPTYFNDMVDDILDNKGVSLMVGLITLAIGFIIIKLHNVWSSDRTVIITVIGWGAFIKGLIFLLSPITGHKLLKPFSHMHVSVLMSLFVILIGLVLIYFGFIA